MISHVTEHLDQAKAHLLEQFKASTNLRALLDTYVSQIQDIEDALYGLLLGRWLDNAEGVQLDGLGDIVGEARQGRTDTDYRLAIRVRIKINLCEGAPEQIIEIFVLLTNWAVELKEYTVAAFVLTVLGALPATGYEYVVLISRTTGDTLINRDGEVLLGRKPTSLPFASLLSQYLQTVKPAGVQAQLRYWASPTDEIFQFDSGPGWDRGKWAGAI
jgi:hypothetical protein